MTTLAMPEQKAFLASDLLYDKVHTWCGPGVNKQEIHHWIEILNGMLEMANEGGWAVYAGHGGMGDKVLVSAMQDYLRKFLEVTASEKTKQSAIDKMKGYFPGFAQDDFLLVHSVDFHM